MSNLTHKRTDNKKMHSERVSRVNPRLLLTQISPSKGESDLEKSRKMTKLTLAKIGARVNSHKEAKPEKRFASPEGPTDEM